MLVEFADKLASRLEALELLDELGRLVELAVVDVLLRPREQHSAPDVHVQQVLLYAGDVLFGGQPLVVVGDLGNDFGPQSRHDRQPRQSAPPFVTSSTRTGCLPAADTRMLPCRSVRPKSVVAVESGGWTYTS